MDDETDPDFRFTRMRFGRRALLAGLAASSLAGPGWTRPRPRPGPEAPPPTLAEIIAGAPLAAETGVALIDLDTGALLESHQAGLARPPASVVKIVTALWALEALGPAYRFSTRVIAEGEIVAGVVQGDLVLAGGGDPTLDTDGLGDLVEALRAQGVRGITGRFRVDAGALAPVERLEAGQPEDAGYNPAISGINLNYNRVKLQWAPGRGGPEVGFSAPGRRFDVPVDLRAELTGRGAPRHRREPEGEVWVLDPASLRGRESRWLPVRDPPAYAGAVFRSLAGAADLELPVAEASEAADRRLEPVARREDKRAGRVLARRDSPPLGAILQDMLFYSTNLTAEVVGLRATQAKGLPAESLETSAEAMAAWARARFGARQARFSNHSGLSDRSELSAAGMVRILSLAPELAALLRERPILDGERAAVATPGVRLLAKTGTIYFAVALAGIIEVRGRPRLGFAIFAADPDARAAIDPPGRDRPPGASTFAARARNQQHALLRRWVALYAR